MSSGDSGTIVARPRAVYRPPANSDASESTLDIGPEPPPKDDKYLNLRLSPAPDAEEFGQLKYGKMWEDDIEKQTWRSTLETTREGDVFEDDSLIVNSAWSKFSPSKGP